MSKEVTIKHTYKLKRGKEEALIALNPMLLDGEPIVAFMEDGSVNMKVGDGVHTYNELDWIKGDDTPTVPFIDLGYITEDEFNNALDTLTQINCVGTCRLKGPNYTAYFEQWVNMDDTSETAVTGMQFKKMYPGNGVQQRRLTSRWVGHTEYYWGEWEPLPVDITDIGNHFDSTKLDDVLDQLGNNQIIDLGEFTSPSALSGYDWEEGRVYNVEFSNYSITLGAYNKKQQFIYYANADGSGDVATGYADGHYIESIHTYENNCRLRIYIRSGYPYEIVHDNNLLMYPIGINTGSITSYSQNKAIKYLRDYLDNYISEEKIPNATTVTYLQQELQEFYVNNNTDKKPFIIWLHAALEEYGLCIGEVIETSSGYDYNYYSLYTGKSYKYTSQDNIIKELHDETKLDTLIIPSGLMSSKIDTLLLDNYSKNFVAIANPVNDGSKLYINMFRGQYSEQISIEATGIRSRTVYESKNTPWKLIVKNVTVDNTLDINSTNAIQNKVVSQAINDINTRLNNTLSVTLTDQVTGKDYLVYVSNGQLMLEEKSEE